MYFGKAPPERKELERHAGNWLKDLRKTAGLSQVELAQRLGLKYCTFVAQIENGFGRVPSAIMEAWGRALGVEPADFARELLKYYDPELHRLISERQPNS